MGWDALRTLTAQAAEGVVAPTDNAFVTNADGYAEYVEVRFDALTLTGSPSSVRFALWRLEGGKKDRVGVVDVDATDAAAPAPAIFDLHGGRGALVVESFVGGSAPTVAGVTQWRELHP